MFLAENLPDVALFPSQIPPHMWTLYLLNTILKAHTLLHLLALDEKAAMMRFSIKHLTDLESDS